MENIFDIWNKNISKQKNTPHICAGYSFFAVRMSSEHEIPGGFAPIFYWKKYDICVRIKNRYIEYVISVQNSYG
ncbi:hypothetical protein F320042A7_15960 [Blautia producta]